MSRKHAGLGCELWIMRMASHGFYLRMVLLETMLSMYSLVFDGIRMPNRYLVAGKRAFLELMLNWCAQRNNELVAMGN